MGWRGDASFGDEGDELLRLVLEIGCLNQAANAGVNPQGGTMRAVTIRKPGNANHATPKPPCSTCENVQKQMGVN